MATPAAAITDGSHTIGGVIHHVIRDLSAVDPFLMTVVSAGDVWLFLGSHGGITAGRRNPDHAIFPYCTEDKLADTAPVTGPLTLIRSGSGPSWEPLLGCDEAVAARWLARTVLGDEVTWGEERHDLGLEFRVSWRCSPRFGVVRECRLTNISDGDVAVEILDGFRNILPAGCSQQTQNDLSVLLNAYKRSKIDDDTGLGIHSLSSLLTDVAEPAEALSATTTWRLGTEALVSMASESQVDAFRKGVKTSAQLTSRGVRGAHLAVWEATLQPGSFTAWTTVVDTGLDTAQAHDLHRLLQDPTTVRATLEDDLEAARVSLMELLVSADASQSTGDEGASAHHLASVLYNGMRGGIPREGHAINREDLRRHMVLHNTALAERQADRIDSLPAVMSPDELISWSVASGDADVERLAMTYLPLSFSRRHGDPSRPWNRFDIVLNDSRGRPINGYQGNWRDIFQNWEATAMSYPELTENMVAIFLNATTVDGYNPYRVTHAGIDWEVPEPENPWANIGYWGDHQIVYLLRLLELSRDFHPGRVASWLGRAIFATADVPYRIATFDAILQNPSATIGFDDDVDREARERARSLGGDGLLKHAPSGDLFRTTLADKLLTLAAAKMINFVPDAGIWLNTQRPEWNDANNALVGRGTSVVTMAYLVRYLGHIAELMAGKDVSVRPELASLIAELTEVLTNVTEPKVAIDEIPMDAGLRHAVVAALGRAGEAYRASCYPCHAAEAISISSEDVARFLTVSQQWLRRGVRANRRSDGLLHGYNTLDFTDSTIEIRRLSLMLEGQVAVLSAGVLAPHEVLDIVTALRSSLLYRADQHSYLLYPNRELPGFLERNTIEPALLSEGDSVDQLLADPAQDVVVRDGAGAVHFAAGVKNAEVLAERLATVAGRGVDVDAPAVAELYEQTFDHANFTGRSGSFFAYEGLGSIYWHMVSKLALAVLDAHHSAIDQGAEQAVVEGLGYAYRDIRSGLGFAKTAYEFGAFPADPYSHTPAHTGARQPGMTGQAKEDVIMRFHELGVRVSDGVLQFQPERVDEQDWLTVPAALDVLTRGRTLETIPLQRDELGFTFCGVPVIYRRGASGITLALADGTQVVNESGLDRATSARIFARDGHIQQIVVGTGISPGPQRPEPGVVTTVHGPTLHRRWGA